MISPKNNDNKKRSRNFLLFSAAIQSAIGAETISEGLDSPITTAQADALRFLFLNENVAMGKIALGLGYTTSGATKAINRLEEKDWVVRHSHSDDHREVVVSLTPKGREIASKIVEITEERINDLLSLLPEETLNRLDSVLEEFLKKVTLEDKFTHKLCVACGFEGGLDCTNSKVDCAIATTRRETSVEK